jgi:hypothetical protein
MIIDRQTHLRTSTEEATLRRPTSGHRVARVARHLLPIKMKSEVAGDFFVAYFLKQTGDNE